MKKLEDDRWLRAAHALSATGMSLTRFVEVYGPKLETIINNTTVKRSESVRANAAEGALRIVMAENKRLKEELAEMQKVLDGVEIEHGLTDNGNLWRFWSAKAKELAEKVAVLEGRKEQA